ncbi:MAG TPA: methyltransferase domain-containing protein, partial [Gemmatimonadales bacterium]|nr:methyltransferase domain-containing protein [Gemmatimonadales bacterium]
MSRGEIAALVARLEGHQGTEPHGDAARDLERLLTLARLAEAADVAGTASSCGRLRALYGRYVSRLETAEARALLARGTGVVGLALGEGGDFAGRSYARVRDLFDYVDFTDCRTFVMVGCGPLPVTLLHVARRARVPRLVGLEVEPESARDARALCRELGVDTIEVQECDGGEFDYSEADVIYIANLVRAKRAVLTRVARTARAGARVVVREPSSVGELVAERGVDVGDSWWRVLARGPEDPQFLSYHLFLELPAPL